MSIILAIVIGLIALLAGVGLAYSLLEHRLNIQEQRHRTRARREIEEVERSYSDRMQQRIDALKAQYETQIQQLTAQSETPQLDTLKAQYEGQIADLSQQIEALKAQYENQITDLTQQLASTPIVTAPPPPAATIEPEPASALLEEESDREITPVSETESTPEMESAPEMAPPPLEATPVPVLGSSRTTGVTLEDLKNLAYTPQDETRILLAECLLEILESQPQTEIPQGLLLQILQRLSQDPVPRLRELGVLCLAKTHSSLAVPLLRSRLRDTDPAVVQAANQALDFWRPHGKVKPPKAKAKPRKSSRLKS